MSSRQERAAEQQHSKRVKRLIIAIIIGLVIIVVGSMFAFHQLNKRDKIETQATLSQVKKREKTAVTNSDSESKKASSVSSSSVESDVSDASAVGNSELASTDEYYVNAYGHTIKKGEQDNTGIAIKDRERNVDLKNLDYIITAPLTYEQKMIQMKAWKFSFTPNPPSKELTIWGRDTSTEAGAIGVIYPDGTVTKIN